MRISDWSSDVCSSDLADADAHGNSDLAEREAPGGKADEAARKAENGDDLAARAFEEISEFGEGRIEGGVSAGISRTGTGERHESGQDIVLEPGTAGKLNRGIHRTEERRVGTEGGSTCGSGWPA